jgi:hypothetical protein
MEPSSDAAAQIIAASGTAAAAVIGAIVLWPTRRRRERAAINAVNDPEELPGRLRERIRATETRLDDAERRLEHIEDELPLLRAQEITAETLARVTAGQRRTPRKRPT